MFKKLRVGLKFLWFEFAVKILLKKSLLCNVVEVGKNLCFWSGSSGERRHLKLKKYVRLMA